MSTLSETLHRHWWTDAAGAKSIVSNRSNIALPVDSTIDESTSDLDSLDETF